MMSTPSGSPSRPRSSSSTRIFRATSSARPLRRDAAQRRDAGARALLAEPRAVELVMPRGRAEVPQDRLVALRQQREADELVHRPRADVGRGDVADVVHVEAEQRAQLGLGERALRARQPLAAAAGRSRPAAPSRRPSSRTFDPHRSTFLPTSSRAICGHALAASGRSRPRAAARTGSGRPSQRSAAPARRGRQNASSAIVGRELGARRRSCGDPRRRRSRVPVFRAERDERLAVERDERARVDHLARSTPSSSSVLGRGERHVHHRARRDDGDVLALALDVGDAERDRVLAPRAPRPLTA